MGLFTLVLAAGAMTTGCATADLAEPLLNMESQRYDAVEKRLDQRFRFSLANIGVENAAPTKGAYRIEFRREDGVFVAEQKGTFALPEVKAGGDAVVTIDVPVMVGSLLDAHGVLPPQEQISFYWDSDNAVTECDEANSQTISVTLGNDSLNPRIVDDLTSRGTLEPYEPEGRYTPPKRIDPAVTKPKVQKPGKPKLPQP